MSFDGADLALARHVIHADDHQIADGERLLAAVLPRVAVEEDLLAQRREVVLGRRGAVQGGARADIVVNHKDGVGLIAHGRAASRV